MLISCLLHLPLATMKRCSLGRPRSGSQPAARRLRLLALMVVMNCGMFLMPLRALGSNQAPEIGLGCDMSYGPGPVRTLKTQLLPDAQMWEAELDANCVRSILPCSSSCASRL